MSPLEAEDWCQVDQLAPEVTMVGVSEEFGKMTLAAILQAQGKFLVPFEIQYP